jgi:hypothetical protein
MTTNKFFFSHNLAISILVGILRALKGFLGTEFV